MRVCWQMKRDNGGLSRPGGVSKSLPGEKDGSPVKWLRFWRVVHHALHGTTCMAFERWTELLHCSDEPWSISSVVARNVVALDWLPPLVLPRKRRGASSRVLLEGAWWRVSTDVTGGDHADLFALSVLLPLLCFGFDILCVGYRSYSVAKGWCSNPIRGWSENRKSKGITGLFSSRVRRTVLTFLKMSISMLQGHPAKNNCSTEVLLDFCPRATFLRMSQCSLLHNAYR